MSGRVVSLWSAQWRGGLITWLSGVLAMSDECVVDEIYGGGGVRNWSKVSTKDVPANC